MNDWHKELDKLASKNLPSQKLEEVYSPKPLSEVERKKLDLLIDKWHKRVEDSRAEGTEVLMKFFDKYTLRVAPTEVYVYEVLMNLCLEVDNFRVGHGLSSARSLTMAFLCDSLNLRFTLATSSYKPLIKEDIKKALHAMRDRGHVEYVDPTGWRLTGNAVELAAWCHMRKQELEWGEWSKDED